MAHGTGLAGLAAAIGRRLKKRNRHQTLGGQEANLFSWSGKNSRNDSVMLELLDPHTVDAIYRRDEQVTQTDRWQVSADGQQMTLSTTGTLEPGQPITEKLVFKKQ